MLTLKLIFSSHSICNTNAFKVNTIFINLFKHYFWLLTILTQVKAKSKLLLLSILVTFCITSKIIGKIYREDIQTINMTQDCILIKLILHLNVTQNSHYISLMASWSSCFMLSELKCFPQYVLFLILCEWFLFYFVIIQCSLDSILSKHWKKEFLSIIEPA